MHTGTFRECVAVFFLNKKHDPQPVLSVGNCQHAPCCFELRVGRKGRPGSPENATKLLASSCWGFFSEVCNSPGKLTWLDGLGFRRCNHWLKTISVLAVSSCRSYWYMGDLGRGMAQRVVGEAQVKQFQKTRWLWYGHWVLEDGLYNTL